MNRKHRRWLPMLMVVGVAAAMVVASQSRLFELPAVQPAAEDDGVSVYFSPHGGCEAAVVEQIRRASHSVDVQAYSFTSMPIAEELAHAQHRGVTVRVLMDHDAANDPYSQVTYLVHHAIPLYTDAEHPIAHNKVMILDGATVITGSFNFTRQAEEANAENLLVIQGRPKLAGAYEANFEAHLRHSARYR